MKRIARSSYTIISTPARSSALVASNSYASKTGDRTTPTTPSPHAARPNETMTQPQPSHANEKDFLSHQYSDMINVVKPKLKTTPQLDVKTFGTSAKKSSNAEQLLKKAKESTTAFIASDKSQRFARDLFLTSVQYDKQPTLLLEDLSQFADQIKNDNYLNQMFKSTLTPVNIRRSALKEYISKANFKSFMTAEALRVLSDIKALPLISTVVTSLQRLTDLYSKKLDVNVTLAQDSEAERKKVTEQLTRMIGDQAQVTYNFKVDPDLISGLRAETMGQLLIDTSGRKSLEDDALKYMQELDNEIQRLKRTRNQRQSGALDAQGTAEREWRELLDDVQVLSQVKSSQTSATSQSDKTSQSSDMDVEDNDRVQALTEIYRFKRARN